MTARRGRSELGRAVGGPELVTYAITYSYPTWDKNYRGQRGIRVTATSEDEAIEKVRRGLVGTYGLCPDARIVRCVVSPVQA